MCQPIRSPTASFFLVRGFECEPFCAHSVLRRKMCWVQHGFDAPAHVSSTNPFCHWPSVVVSSHMTTRIVLFFSFLPSCALSAPEIIVVSVLPRCLLQILLHFSCATPSSPYEGSVRLPERTCLLCCVFQGGQRESFTDLFGPPDLPLPRRVEQESNSMFLLSTSPSHKYVATFCFPRFAHFFPPCFAQKDRHHRHQSSSPSNAHRTTHDMRCTA